jgi:hypothetical protein
MVSPRLLVALVLVLAIDPAAAVSERRPARDRRSPLGERVLNGAGAVAQGREVAEGVMDVLKVGPGWSAFDRCRDQSWLRKDGAAGAGSLATTGVGAVGRFLLDKAGDMYLEVRFARDSRCEASEAGF